MSKEQLGNYIDCQYQPVIPSIDSTQAGQALYQPKITEIVNHQPDSVELAVEGMKTLPANYQNEKVFSELARYFDKGEDGEAIALINDLKSYSLTINSHNTTNLTNTTSNSHNITYNYNYVDNRRWHIVQASPKRELPPIQHVTEHYHTSVEVNGNNNNVMVGSSIGCGGVVGAVLLGAFGLGITVAVFSN